MCWLSVGGWGLSRYLAVFCLIWRVQFLSDKRIWFVFGSQVDVESE